MAIDTQRYIRKPLYVDAVRITPVNFDEICAWCQGVIEHEVAEGPAKGKKYIHVRVHNPKNIRQSKAFVGDWLLYTERGYKVYTSKAFFASFDLAAAVGSQTMNNPDPGMTGSDQMNFIPSAHQPVPNATVESMPEQEKVAPAAVEGKHVLSIEEQKRLTAEEIKEMVQSGQAVLVQDIGQF